MNRKQLQAAGQYLVERYGAWATHMLTLTFTDMKRGGYVIQGGWAKGAVNSYEYELTAEAAMDSVRYFVEALNYKCFGRKTRKQRTKNVCRILAIPVLEGLNSCKRVHTHILLGNIPVHMLTRLEDTVQEIWANTKWGMRRMQLDELHDLDGAAHYLTKEVGYINDGAVCWEHASVPGRLLGKWS